MTFFLNRPSMNFLCHRYIVHLFASAGISVTYLHSKTVTPMGVKNAWLMYRQDSGKIEGTLSGIMFASPEFSEAQIILDFSSILEEL